MATSDNIPAERIRPGVAMQKVNVLDENGNFRRQVMFRGTERKARLHAQILMTHPTEPGFDALLREYRSIPE